MKKIYFVLAVFAVLASSCTKENICNENSAVVSGTLTASVPSDTKIALGEKEGNVTKLVWTAGDELYVFGYSNSLSATKYWLRSESEGKTTGVFQSNDPLSEDGEVYAFYPYSQSKVINGKFNAITIPSSLTPETIGLMPMCAVGTLTDGITFKHLCSIIRLQLYTSKPTGNVITNVSISNANPIARTYYYSLVDKKYEIAVQSSANVDTIEYTCETQLSTKSDSPTVIDIPIACLNGCVLSNFTVKVEDSCGNSFSKTMSGVKTVRAGRLVTFGTLDCILNDN